MTPRKLDLLIATFPYGGVGASSAEHPACRQFIMSTVLTARQDGRVGRIETKNWADTPITMTRNAAIRYAQENGYDLLLMLDSDMHADILVGKDPQAKPFFPVALDFIDSHYHKGPHVICAPYCGPPPHSPVYVFKWCSTCTDYDERHYRLEMYSREEAAGMAGIQPCAAQPTGLILFDVRVFDLIEPPYFRYEYTDKYESEKGSTEDVACTRDISLAGLNKLGYSPLYCAWDCWAGHIKPLTVSKPKFIAADEVNETYRQAVLGGRQHNERLMFVGAGEEEPRNGKPRRDPHTEETVQAVLNRFGGQKGYLGHLNKILRDQKTQQEPDLIRIGDMHTPERDLKALEQVVQSTYLRRRAEAVENDEINQIGGWSMCAVEIGSWVGESARAIMRGMFNRGQLHLVDTFEGSPGDITGELSKKYGPEAIRASLEANLSQRSRELYFCIHEYPSTEMADCWGHGQIDFLFIDADHSYEAVKADIAAWLPHLRDGGTIAFHDYNTRSFPGVTKAVMEAFGPHVQRTMYNGEITTVAYVVVTEEVRREYERKNAQQAEPGRTAESVSDAGRAGQADEPAAETAGTV